MNIVAIVQARTSSTRLPQKVLIELNHKPALANIAERVERSKTVSKLVIATSTDPSDDPLETLCRDIQVCYFRGDLNNVLQRYYECATAFQADIVVRLTGDNTLVDPDIIDEAVYYFLENKLDYLAYRPGLPLGMGVEVFTYEALKKTYNEATDRECLEHVTPYIKNNPDKFRIMRCYQPNGADYSHLRWTMDSPEDYLLIKNIYNSFPNNAFTFHDVISLLEKYPEWTVLNSSVQQIQISYTGENK